MKVKSGKVVLAKYYDFEGNHANGLFLVLYAENDDISVSNVKNHTVLKITTQLETAYSVKINRNKNSFLEKDCCVSCSKVQTFNDDQIFKELGELDDQTMKKVFKTFHKFFYELERQLLESTF